MINASPRSTPLPTWPCTRDGGLAPFNVLDCEDFHEHGDLLPAGTDTRPAADSEESGGLFIALGWSLPVGLMVWILAWWLMS